MQRGASLYDPPAPLNLDLEDPILRDPPATESRLKLGQRHDEVRERGIKPEFAVFLRKPRRTPRMRMIRPDDLESGASYFAHSRDLRLRLHHEPGNRRLRDVRNRISSLDGKTGSREWGGARSARFGSRVALDTFFLDAPAFPLDALSMNTAGAFGGGRFDPSTFPTPDSP